MRYKIKKGIFVLLLLFIAKSYLSACEKDAQNGEEGTGNPLNILLITTDDQGINAGCYGDELAVTPNIDRLAQEGILFTNAYVTHASCSPSRSSILTGLYPHQNGQIGLAGKHPEYNIRNDIPLLPDLMRNAGYKTGIIGKLHLSPGDLFQFDFDYRNANRPVEKRRDVNNIAKLAEQFLLENQQYPFFLYVNFFDPHRPYENRDMQFNGLPENPYQPENVHPFDYLGLDGEAVRREVAGYYNCVIRLDVGIGLLLDQLKKFNLHDNTVVIFLGDQGVPFTRAKTTCYEAGTKIPFIIKFPGQEVSGFSCQELVSTVDIMPTILDVARIHCPDEVAGISLRPLLTGNNPENWRSYLFTEYTSHSDNHFYPRRSVRDKKYKLIHNLDYHRKNPVPFIGATRIGADVTVSPAAKEAYITNNHPPEWELYDLSKDPHELENIAAKKEYRPVLEKLQQALMAWRIETKDPLLDEDELIRLRKEHGIN
jgi:N-sulfoglucosamine sulfohydrolase